MSTFCPRWRNTYSTNNTNNTDNTISTDNIGTSSSCGSGKKYKKCCGKNK